MKRPGCTIIGTVVAKPEKRKELHGILLAQVAPTRAEEGCVSYDFHCDHTDPNVFVFYENFVDRDALEVHLKKPYLEPLFGRVEELLAKPVDIRFLDMLSDRAS
ncbi:MAG: putative quinol monooxygenase [Roseiarcus sp.]